MTLAILTDQINNALHSIAPSSDALLYGSRARGEATDESDWDILLLLDDVTRQEKQELRRVLYELEWQTGQVMSVIIHTRDEWRRLAGTPFHKRVTLEGISLWTEQTPKLLHTA